MWPSADVFRREYIGPALCIKYILKNKVILFQWSAKILSLDVLRANAKCIDCGENEILLVPRHLDTISVGCF